MDRRGRQINATAGAEAVVKRNLMIYLVQNFNDSDAAEKRQPRATMM